MVRFFFVLRPCPAYALTVLAAVTALGMATLWFDPAELDSGLGMVLFVQMFLASSGFVVTARRGHFDPVLLVGSDRIAALAAQWLASIAPGAIAWTVLAGTGAWLGSAAAWSALAGLRVIAFLIVSVVAWICGFRLPRGAGGALWMGGLAVLLLRHVELIAPERGQGSALEVLRAAAALLVCPFLLLGSHARIEAPAASAALAAAAAALFTTWRLGGRFDVFLAERS
jgi:hypothetical protein